jgi:RNA polymerase sigma-70 factor, ECF subfamily
MIDNKTVILLKRLKANDQKALKIIFQEHYPDVYRATFRLISNKAVAEDLTQDVFIRFWEKRHQITIKDALGAYLRRMGINEALGFIRKNKKYNFEEIAEHHSATICSSEDIYLELELQNEINKAIDSLPAGCRTVFMLSRFEQLSYREISNKLNISPKTVENHISKALKKMRFAINTYLGCSVIFFFL